MQFKTLTSLFFLKYQRKGKVFNIATNLKYQPSGYCPLTSHHYKEKNQENLRPSAESAGNQKKSDNKNV